MDDVKEGKDYSFPEEEEQVLRFWSEIDAFKQQLKLSEGKPEFVFYDGPPFATGLPHYGHILAGTIKDIVTRYASSTGHHVSRRFGWDCHGLPVEYEIDRTFDIKSREDVMKMGIPVYNEECRKIVMRYSKEWESTVVRLGRWIDFKNDYKTLDVSFMESVWWVFKQLYEKDLVYQGFKVMAFSTGCGTPLSNFEAGLNYKDVQDPSITVTFPVIDDPDGTCLVAWTTTPWTLPSNIALCVNEDFDYVKVKDPKTGALYIVAECLLSSIPGAVASKKKDKTSGFEIVAKMKGKELVGLCYEPLFPYFKSMKDSGCFRVLSDGYVTSDSGTGIVHQAPAFGEDDYRVCLAHRIIEKGGFLPCPVDDSGHFTEEVHDFSGIYVKDADKLIVKEVKAKGRLLDLSTLQHSYPFCWRSETPLIYKAVPSWFVKVEAIKDRLLENNKDTYWVPNSVKEGRFHNWLENARDWAISRSRFWGTPLPIWMSEDGEEIIVIGSQQELEEKTGQKANFSQKDKNNFGFVERGKGQLHRVEEVFDCWFESGSMPYAQLHYPFENKELLESNFPADFIAEGLDQTRGWFYTLMVLSTALFDKPAFKNNVVNGMVLASDGKKMSKRLKNYPDPVEVVNKYGADALRLYLIDSPVVRGESIRFTEEGVRDVVKVVFLPWYNAYRFLVQNTLRWQQETNQQFDPSKVDLSQVSNVFDKWISAAARSLTNYVRQEMDAYKLYTVVPYLVKFIDNLTNIYGKDGPEDSAFALASLFDVLLTLCKVMSPFTPFLTEKMYRNLRQTVSSTDQATLPISVHFCDYPDTVPLHSGDERIQKSVDRMQRVVELGRKIRAQKNIPIKMPIRELIVVHPDNEFLCDVTGDLSDYVKEEMNVSNLSTCDDPLEYAKIKAEPDWRALGSRLGKSMGPVSKQIKSLDVASLLKLEQEGSLEIAGFLISSTEIRVLREFKMPEGVDESKIAANSDNDVLVVMDLHVDTQMIEQGFAREIVNRYQKLRKKAGLTVTDAVELYYELKSQDPLFVKSLESQQEYLKKALGSVLMPLELKPMTAQIIFKEEQSIKTEEGNIEFEAFIAPLTVAVDASVFEEEAECTEVAAYLAEKERTALIRELESTGGVLEVTLNGREMKLKTGMHFYLSASEKFEKIKYERD
eukprot:g3651.t1